MLNSWSRSRWWSVSVCGLCRIFMMILVLVLCG